MNSINSAKPFPAVEIKNLNVSVSGKKVLKNISLKLERGKFYALLGANGAGKSTLIKSLCGLERFKGEIRILGKKFNEVQKNVLGYIPQNNVPDKNCPVSVFEAVSIGRFAKNGIFKKFSKKDERIVLNALKTAKIEKLKNFPAGDLSGGEVQKVSIARVIAQRPEIVLLDEPQSNLDRKSQTDFLNFVERLHKKFKFTCLMVTHDVDLIPKYCDKVFVMENGEIVERQVIDKR